MHEYRQFTQQVNIVLQIKKPAAQVQRAENRVRQAVYRYLYSTSALVRSFCVHSRIISRCLIWFK